MTQDYTATANATWKAVHFDRAPHHVPTNTKTNNVYFEKLRASQFSFNGDAGRHSEQITCVETGCTIFGGIGNDTITGGRARDVLNGGSENDVLLGQDGNDTLDGGIGNDRLDGGNGDDAVIGRVGADTLTDGPGNDTFVYAGMGESVQDNPDIITDFNPKEDTIDLSRTGIQKANITVTNSANETIVSATNRNKTVTWTVKLSGIHNKDEIIFVEGTSAKKTKTVTSIKDTVWAAVRSFGQLASSIISLSWFR
jgi:Ca2+-binding RTX toxin-like protein